MTELETESIKALKRLLELFTESGWPIFVTNDKFGSAVNDEGRDAIIHARKIVGAHITW